MDESNGLRILCLDGGDARCMSQLYILQEYMNRIQFKLENKILPCECFDLIVGVDSSSAIAIFLGLLRMSVEDAQNAFYQVYTGVFGNESYSSKQRASKLEDEIKRLLDSRDIAHTTRLSDPSFTSSCKVALLYSPSARLDHCAMFRNYTAHQQSTTDVTILEAIRTAWATPGLVAPSHIGPKGFDEEVVSAVGGFGNPVQEIIKEAYQLLGPKAQVRCLLSLGSGYRGIVSLDDEDNTPRSVGGRVMMNNDTVAEEVYRRFARLGIYYRLSVDHGLEGWGRFGTAFGAMKSHADAYLSKKEQGGNLDRCVSASMSATTVTLDQLYASKTQGMRSAHGLPPLSAYFVTRRKPMEAMIKCLIEGNKGGQRIMVLSGLGGSGKTQLALKFARDFQDSYRHILFIDAGSSDTIRRGLVARVRSMGSSNQPMTPEEAIDLLANPDEDVTKDWFIIFDNADNPDVGISSYIPWCDHGSILITTRDASLGELAPASHLKLGNMDEDEAVEVLLSAAFPSRDVSSDTSHSQTEERTSSPTPRDKEAAKAIARELGCLAIAVVQAGCYIKQHKVLHEYLEQLKTNRAELLKRTTRFHLDRLKYPHGVYASFDIVINALSPRAIELLSVLSFFHFSNFPRPLFAIAAKSKFSYELFDFLDRPSTYQESIQLLIDILCPDGEWKEHELNQLLEELQRYSLVVLVPTGAIIALRFHPLVHGWARDRMSKKEQGKHRAAATRLFVSGITEGDDYGLYEHLSSHAAYFYTFFDSLHVNDRAAIAVLLESTGSNTGQNLQIWRSIYNEVEAAHGKMDGRTSRAKLWLADAIADNGDRRSMEVMEREVVEVNETVLGRDHLGTVEARANLARTLKGFGRYDEVEVMERDNLKIYIRQVGVTHRKTATGMQDLAVTYDNLGRQSDRKALLLGLVALNTKLLGRSAQRTIASLELLAQCQIALRQDQEAEEIRREVLELRQQLHGEQHLTTVASMVWLSARYQEQGRYEEAKLLRKSEVDARRVLQGEHHAATLDALYWLGKAAFQLAQYAEAEEAFKALDEGRKAVNGNVHPDTLLSTYWVGRTAFEQSRFGEAEKIWKEWHQGCLKTHGKFHQETLNAMHWIARSISSQGKNKEAAELWKEHLAACKEGKRPRQTQLNSMGWLANCLFGLKEYEEAEKLWKEQYEGRLKMFGESNVNTIWSLGWLARVNLELGNHKEAVKLYRRRLVERRRMLGDRNVETLNAIKWLTKSEFHLGNYEEVEKLRKEELDARREVQGNQHVDTLDAMHWLGRAYYEQKKYAEAEKIWRERLPIMREVHGDRAVGTLNSMGWLAKPIFDEKRYDEAGELWTEQLAARRVVLGEDHADTIYSMGMLGRVHYEKGRNEEAEALFKEQLGKSREKLGQRHTKTLESITWLAATYFRQRNYEESAKLRQEHLDAMRELHGNQHEDTLDAMYEVGRSLFEGKKHEEATVIWKEWLEGCKEAYGVDDSKTMDANYWLGRALFVRKLHSEAEELWEKELPIRRKLDSRILLGRLLHQLARLYNATDRYEEATSVAEEVIGIRREVYGEKDSRLKDSIKLLESIQANIKAAAEKQDVPADGDNAEVQGAVQGDAETNPKPELEVDSGEVEADLAEDGSAPDPGGDPAYLPSPEAAAPNWPIERPRSPFDMRHMFGNRPNSYSML